jgi:hypothetical protein
MKTHYVGITGTDWMGNVVYESVRTLGSNITPSEQRLVNIVIKKLQIRDAEHLTIINDIHPILTIKGAQHLIDYAWDAGYYLEVSAQLFHAVASESLRKPGAMNSIQWLPSVDTCLHFYKGERNIKRANLNERILFRNTMRLTSQSVHLSANGCPISTAWFSDDNYAAAMIREWPTVSIDYIRKYYRIIPTQLHTLVDPAVIPFPVWFNNSENTFNKYWNVTI